MGIKTKIPLTTPDTSNMSVSLSQKRKKCQ